MLQIVMLHEDLRYLLLSLTVLMGKAEEKVLNMHLLLMAVDQTDMIQKQ